MAYHTEEIKIVGGAHVVRMLFEMDYLDWLKFQKSIVFHDLINYLQELEKRYDPQTKQEASD